MKNVCVYFFERKDSAAPFFTMLFKSDSHAVTVLEELDYLMDLILNYTLEITDPSQVLPDEIKNNFDPLIKVEALHIDRKKLWKSDVLAGKVYKVLGFVNLWNEPLGLRPFSSSSEDGDYDVLSVHPTRPDHEDAIQASDYIANIYIDSKSVRIIPQMEDDVLAELCDFTREYDFWDIRDLLSDFTDDFDSGFPEENHPQPTSLRVNLSTSKSSSQPLLSVMFQMTDTQSHFFDDLHYLMNVVDDIPFSFIGTGFRPKITGYEGNGTPIKEPEFTIDRYHIDPRLLCAENDIRLKAIRAVEKMGGRLDSSPDNLDFAKSQYPDQEFVTEDYCDFAIVSLVEPNTVNPDDGGCYVADLYLDSKTVHIHDPEICGNLLWFYNFSRDFSFDEMNQMYSQQDCDDDFDLFDF